MDGLAVIGLVVYDELWRGRMRPSLLRPRTLGKFSIINQEKSFLQSSQYEYETKYFTQRLDHFSFKNHKNSTFQQRYLINDKSWLGAERMGPIFYYCGNEGYIDWFAVNIGFMWDIAPQFGALLVFPEVSNSSCLGTFIVEIRLFSTSRRRRWWYRAMW